MSALVGAISGLLTLVTAVAWAILFLQFDAARRRGDLTNPPWGFIAVVGGITVVTFAGWWLAFHLSR